MTQLSHLPLITKHDATPANHLLVELKTRITTQRLHYRSGDEETAAASVYKLFPTTRTLLVENLKGAAFRAAGLYLLNDIVRPYTARWHRWMVDKRFTDERARRQFRTELRELQLRLHQFVELLDLLVGGAAKQAEAERIFAAIVTGSPPPPVPTPTDQVANLGGEVEALIDLAVIPHSPPNPPDEVRRFAKAEDINQAEREFIHRRRRALGHRAPEKPVDDKHQPVVDATGLCLSGGGIRSATFCLGIVQVLARLGMLHQLDYLSTVSGGGYLGSFLTAYLGTRKSETDPNAPFSKGEIDNAIDDAFKIVDSRESAAVRHLRNKSRYLLNGGVWGRLRALGLVVSGILTNLLLVLPLPLLAAVAVAGLAFMGYWKGWPESMDA
jgi:hypothetical protein